MASPLGRVLDNPRAWSAAQRSDKAHLDDGAMWPNSYALVELTAAAEARVAALVKEAVS